MSKDNHPDNKSNVSLSQDELILLSTQPAAIDDIDVNSLRMKSLRDRVMSRLDEQPLFNVSDLLTVKANEGDWQLISDKIRKKLLYIDEKKGLTSYLLRIEPGAKDSPHQHTSDEHCMVLEGDISFGNIHLRAGDYHLAAKGSWHEEAYSEHGALLYIQTGIEQQMSL